MAGRSLEVIHERADADGSASQPVDADPWRHPRDDLSGRRGTRDEARAEVRRLFDGMGPGGGYIMAPTNHVQVDVPPQNLLEVYRYAQEYGVYAG